MSELCASCQEKATSLLEPLVEAARRSHVNCVQRLIQSGASVNLVNGSGENPLHTAALSENDACVDLLLSRGADVNYFSLDNKKVVYPILTAISKNKKKYFKAFIKAGAHVNVRTYEGKTALMLSATKNDSEFLEILIQAEADVNAKNARLESALIFAVERRKMKNVELLLQAGADVNVCTVNGETAPSIAFSKRDTQCLDLLKNYGIDASKSEAANGRTFVNAALKTDIKAMEWFLLIGLIDVNTANYHGWNAVYTTAAYDCLESLKWLIGAGRADVNSTCSDKIPLVAAAKNGCYESVKVLIEAGADVNMTCSQTGNTALLESAVANQIDCVRLLLQSGAHVNIRNLRRRNALQSHIVHWKSPGKQVTVLLFTAGEMPFIAPKSYKPPYAIPIPIIDFAYRTNVLDLTDICRNVIRAHLIRIDPRLHLFDRIPKIGLPTLLVSYLLYDVSLSDTDN